MIKTIRSRLLLLLVGMSAAAGLGLKLLDVSYREQLSEATAMQREEFHGQIVRTIEMFGATQVNHVYDYTYWDEMVDFVGTGDPQWAQDNIDVGLPGVDVAAAWVLSPDFRIVYGTAPGVDGGDATLPVPIEQLRARLDGHPFQHFYAQSPAGVFEFRTAPIQPTTDKERQTPARGYYVTAKAWSPAFTKRLGEFLTAEVDIAARGNARHADHEELAGHSEFLVPLPGVDDAPVAWLRVHHDSQLLQQWAAQRHRLLLLFLTMTGTLIVVLYLTLTHWVSTPLRLVGAALGSDASAIERLEKTGAEFAAIAGLLRENRAQHTALAEENRERRHLQEELTFIANHDSLTNLPNREYFRQQLQARIDSAAGRGLAVLFIDLDHFKNINDMHGHALGDRFLRAVASRLRDTAGDTGLVGRIGGDEFLMCIDGVDGEDDARRRAAGVLAPLSRPITIDDNEAFPGASIGISLYPAHGTDADTLIAFADQAMYHAKQAGRNTFHIFDATLMQMISRRLTIESQLRRVLERQELHLHYQPRVRREDGRVVSVEALLRWTHPELGSIAPDEFIRIAEDDGLILPIGAWVLREACQQLVRWQQQGLDGIRMAVNLSTKQLRDRGLADDILGIIAETGVQPSHLELELTESALDTNLPATAAFMKALTARGVRFAIDDFGVGYSSLSYLKDLPVNTLKIDRSFIRGAETSPAQSRLVAGIISLAQGLDVNVVAEGVENDQQMELVCRHGCDEVQGYLISRPLTPSAFAAFVEQSRKQSMRPRLVGSS